MEVSKVNDRKEFIRYELIETDTTYMASFISQSYDFVSELTGESSKSRSLAPSQLPSFQISKFHDAEWFMKVTA